MFLRNDTMVRGEGPRWVNGTIGTVTSLAREVRVEVDGVEHEVEPATWEKYKYSWDPVRKRLEKDVVAEFTQFPLRLAWAVTITRRRARATTPPSSTSASGSSARADLRRLSRLTSLEGLYLERPLRPSDIIVDRNVERFMSGGGARDRGRSGGGT